MGRGSGQLVVSPPEEPVGDREQDVFPTEAAPARPRKRPALVLIALVAVLVVGVTTFAAYWFGGRGPKEYGGRAEVLFTTSDSNSASDGPRVIETQKALMLSGAVLGTAGGSAGLSAPKMRDKVSVGTSPNSVLTVTVSDRDPRNAVRLTAAVVNSYLADLTKSLSASSDQGRQVLGARIERLNRTLARRRVQRRKAPSGGVRASVLDLEVRTLTDRVSRLQDGLAELDAQAAASQRADVVTSPYLLSSPLRPKPVRAIGMGAVVGLLIAGGLAVLLLRQRNLSA